MHLLPRGLATHAEVGRAPEQRLRQPIPLFIFGSSGGVARAAAGDALAEGFLGEARERHPEPGGFGLRLPVRRVVDAQSRAQRPRWVPSGGLR